MTFSLLTPAVVALICVLIGIIFRNSRKIPKTELSTTSKKAVPGPWGEEVLKDGTDLHAEEEGMKNYSWLRIGEGGGGFEVQHIWRRTGWEKLLYTNV